MKLGFIGLGRMGLNMVSRLVKEHEVVVWNRSEEPRKKAADLGAKACQTVEELIENLPEKKIIWIMLPAGDVTEDMFQKVFGLLKEGDIIIEGANSNFHDSIRRHQQAKDKGMSMLDVGVSGGIIATETGYPMMIGGKKDIYDYCRPIFDTVGRPEGFDLVGPAGAGHFVKMTHNAVEYGMMQAIAEGFDLMEKSPFDFDLKQISHIWNNGTIVSSLLMQMVEKALNQDPKLDLKPFVQDSGEGRWAAKEAIDNAVPFVVNSYAVHARFASRDDNSLAYRLLAAMRNAFGGHEVKK